jgi:molybdopterin-guanine dinucleotide biosynthesis protein A
MTAIVLAGGRSRRLGRDKALEVIGEQSLIQRVIERLSLISDDIIVVFSSGEQVADKEFKGARTILDSYPASGALVGLYSGLKESKSTHNLVVGCDMPFLNIDLLHHLMSLSTGFDVVIPRLHDKMEPLHAVYSKDCISPIESRLKEGNLKISDFIDAVKVRYVEQDEIDRFDPQHLSFMNVNSEADLERAKTLLERETR